MTRPGQGLCPTGRCQGVECLIEVDNAVHLFCNLSMLGRTRKGRPFFSGDQGELTQPARIVGEWGESSPLYISSVLGRFPDNLEDVVSRCSPRPSPPGES